MKKKRIVAIGRKSPAFDQLIVDPAFCPHENVLSYEDGGVFLCHGEYDDNITEKTICLDCHTELKPEPVNSEPYELDEATRLWISGGEA